MQLANMKKRKVLVSCWRRIWNLYKAAHYMAMHIVPIRWYLKYTFKKRIGYPLNLENPRTFNEKLQWLKIHDRNPRYVKMVDKYEAKTYVAHLIGEKYIIPTLGVWDRFDEIDFDVLPHQFVLKCTHDSGSVVICKNKATFDKEVAKKKLELALSYNYFYSGGFEWPYKNVHPRIMAEALLQDSANSMLNSQITDYKLMCFNGRLKCSFTCTERDAPTGLRVTFFDNNWEKMPFIRHYPSSEKIIPCPINFEKMKELAEILSENLPFARIDFYEMGEKIYFGEITLYPGCGFEEFYPVTWDEKLGSWIDLSVVKDDK